MKKTHLLAKVPCLALIVLPIPVSASSPPNPNANIPWDENPALPDLQKTYANVAAIEAAFNN